MAHTPGPWRSAWRPHLGEWRITDEADSIVAETRPPTDVFGTRGSEEANARLIAAAPTMLTELERFYDALAAMADAYDATGVCPTGHALRQQADSAAAVIAKAKGGAS